MICWSHPPGLNRRPTDYETPGDAQILDNRRMGAPFTTPPDGITAVVEQVSEQVALRKQWSQCAASDNRCMQIRFLRSPQPPFPDVNQNPSNSVSTSFVGACKRPAPCWRPSLEISRFHAGDPANGYQRTGRPPPSNRSTRTCVLLEPIRQAADHRGECGPGAGHLRHAAG